MRFSSLMKSIPINTDRQHPSGSMILQNTRTSRVEKETAKCIQQRDVPEEARRSLEASVVKASMTDSSKAKVN